MNEYSERTYFHAVVVVEHAHVDAVCSEEALDDVGGGERGGRDDAQHGQDGHDPALVGHNQRGEAVRADVNQSVRIGEGSSLDIYVSLF